MYIYRYMYAFMVKHHSSRLHLRPDQIQVLGVDAFAAAASRLLLQRTRKGL